MTTTRTFLLMALLLTSATVMVHAQSAWSRDIQDSFYRSIESSLPIAINFSGSDWCKPCILLTKNVLETPEFEAFAKGQLILLNVDFPRLKKNQPAKEELESRNQLAAKYNQDGVFPLLVIVSPEGKILGKVGYEAEMEKFIKAVEGIIGRSEVQKGNKTGHLYKHEVKNTYNLMGSKFEIAAVHDDPDLVQQAIKVAHDEIARIEKLISSWDEHSQTSAINRNAGLKPTVVDSELWHLVERAKRVSDLTSGAFDISFASVGRLWEFNRTEIVMPSADAIAKGVSKVNYQNILLDQTNTSVLLAEEGMRIGFGAIGKGYAADMAKRKMQSLGIQNGMVSAGGDLTAWGNRRDGSTWLIGIANPNHRGEIISYLPISDESIVTSGDYERYALIDGKRYSHIIDPRTGYPVSGLKSVTIISQSAELSDALATAVTVMGKEKGMDLVNTLNGVEGIMITDENEMLLSHNVQLDNL